MLIDAADLPPDAVRIDASEIVGAPAEDQEPLSVFSEAARFGVVPTEPVARGRGKAKPLPPGDDAPKLHKVLADGGLGSRRDMEELIVSGRVSVNGQPAHIGQRIGPTDQVRVNGRLIKRPAAPPPPRVLVYHKPAGEITTRDDPKQRNTVFDRLPRVKDGRWISVGRLDYNTEGLLIFTTSGDVANKLMHPRYGWEREYAVRILGRIDDEGRQRLLSGIELDDGPAALLSCEDVGGDGANHWYRVVIDEGRNREVRRLFEALGLTVSRLVRIRFGPVGLSRQLARGRWLELPDAEVHQLVQMLAKPVAAQASDGSTDDDEEAAARRAGRDDDDGDEFDDDLWDDDRQPDFGLLPSDEPAPLSAEQQDDDWQPRSANAHLEGITRRVRAGDGLPRKSARGQRRGRQNDPLGLFNPAAAPMGAGRGAASFGAGNRAPGAPRGGNRKRGRGVQAGGPPTGGGRAGGGRAVGGRGNGAPPGAGGNRAGGRAPGGGNAPRGAARGPRRGGRGGRGGGGQPA
ncbi:MAG: pseudouridine synthase [Burkholderiaceae bacterium]